MTDDTPKATDPNLVDGLTSTNIATAGDSRILQALADTGMTGKVPVELLQAINQLLLDRAIEEVKLMPHERDPELKNHKFVEGNELQLEYCHCYKNRRLTVLHKQREQESTPPTADTPLEQAEKIHEIQGMPGNWNYDPYMHGMYNGMELIIATIKGTEPRFKEAPEIWVSSIEPGVLGETEPASMPSTPSSNREEKSNE